MRARTASAAQRSDRFSENCSSVDQRQPPGAGRGLSDACEQASERDIRVDRTESISQPEIGMTVWECGTGDGRGLVRDAAIGCGMERHLDLPDKARSAP